MKEARDVKKEIVKKYDANPRDWRMHVGRDIKGHYDLIVAHGSTAWIIKEEQINPFKFVGYGSKVNRQILEPFIENLPNNFGIRSTSNKQMRELADALERKQSIKDILTKIINSNPISSHEIKGPLIFQGPISYSPKPVTTISEKQKKLDYQLRKELENLLNKKYPQVTRPYI